MSRSATKDSNKTASDDGSDLAIMKRISEGTEEDNEVVVKKSSSDKDEQAVKKTSSDQMSIFSGLAGARAGLADDRVYIQEKSFNSGSEKFIQYCGGRLDVGALVISSDEESRQAISQVLHLLGCRGVWEACNSNVVPSVAAQGAAGSSGSAKAISQRLNIIFVDLEQAYATFEAVRSIPEAPQEPIQYTSSRSNSKRSVASSSDETDDMSDMEAAGSKKKEQPIAVVLICDKRFDRSKVSELIDSHGAQGYITKPLRIQAIRGCVVRYCHLACRPVDREAAEKFGPDQHYERLQMIGKGAFGEVYSVRRSSDGALYAQKEIRINNLDTRAQRRVLTELRLHKSFDCPFIVHSYSAWVNGDYACLLMEYVMGGTLRMKVADCRKAGSSIPDESIIKWCGMILLGLLYLQSKEVIHRDLKLENILGPDAQGLVKLADFGISRQMSADEPLSKLVGTPANLAPERIVDEQAYGPASDMWSLGIVLYELITLNHPFEPRDPIGAADPVVPVPVARDEAVPVVPVPGSPLAAKQTDVFSSIARREPAPLPFHRSNILHRIVTGGLLQKRPEDRPSSGDLCKEPTISAAIHAMLTRTGLIGNAAVLEVIMVINNKGRETVEMPPMDDAVALKNGEGDQLKATVAPLAAEMEASLLGSFDRAGLLKVTFNTEETENTGNTELYDRYEDMKQECAELRRKSEAMSAQLDRDMGWMYVLSLSEPLRWDLKFEDTGQEVMYMLNRDRLRFLSVLISLVCIAACVAYLEGSHYEDFDCRCWSGNFHTFAFSSSARCIFVAALLAMVTTAWLALLIIASARRLTANPNSYGKVPTGLVELVSAWFLGSLMMFAFVNEGTWRLDDHCEGQMSNFADAERTCMSLFMACIVVPRTLPVRWHVLLRTFAVVLVFVAFHAFVLEASAWIVRLAIFSLFSLGILAERWSAERGARLLFLVKANTSSRNQSQYQRSNSNVRFHIVEGPRSEGGRGEGRDNSRLRRGESNVSSASEFRQPRLMRGMSNLSTSSKISKKSRSGSSLALSETSVKNGHFRRSESNVSLVSAVSQSMGMGTGMLRRSASAVSVESRLSKKSRSGSSLAIGASGGGGLLRRSGTAGSVTSEDMFGDAASRNVATQKRSLWSIHRQGTKESWLLDPMRVNVDIQLTAIGAGGFGTVRKGALYGAHVALKVPRNADSVDDAGTISNELRVLRHVWHPNIVFFYGSCIDPGSSCVVLVLELLEGKHLDAYCCATENPPTTEMRHQILLDICSALRYLHSQRPCIVHGDLKGSNILVEMWLAGPRGKLLDFGLSRLLTKEANPLGGTVTWMAPEVIRNPSGRPAPSADVFSLGRLAFMVVVGLRPLANIAAEDIIKDVKQLIVTPLDWPASWEEVPMCDECLPLAEKCLSLTALMRPSMDDVYNRVKSWDSGLEKDEATTSAHITKANSERSLEDGLRQMKKHYAMGVDWFGLVEYMKKKVMDFFFSDYADKAEHLVQEIQEVAQVKHRLIETDRLLLMPDKVLSVGEFGFVVTARLDGTKAAVRVPRVVAVKGMARLAFMQELKRLTVIKHPNIVAMHGITIHHDLGLVSVVLEWVEGVPLDSFLRNETFGLGRVPSLTRQHLLKGISSALWCLHDQKPPITHGDLKGSNIMVESRMAGPPSAKLLDFGWSRLLSGGKKRGVNTATAARRQQEENAREAGHDFQSSPFGLGWRSREMLWMAIKWRLSSRRRALIWTAPEVVRARSRDALEPSADVFSFGFVMYLVITGREPLHGSEAKKIEEALRRGAHPPLEWPDAWPSVWSSTAQGEKVTEAEASLVGRCRPLTEKCCNPRPALRPSIDSVFYDIQSWIPKEAEEKQNRAQSNGSLDTSSVRSALASKEVSASALKLSKESPKDKEKPVRARSKESLRSQASPESCLSPPLVIGQPQAADMRPTAIRPAENDDGLDDVPEENTLVVCPSLAHPLRQSDLKAKAECSGCGGQISLGKRSWKCTDCGYDLCDACVERGQCRRPLPSALARVSQIKSANGQAHAGAASAV